MISLKDTEIKLYKQIGLEIKQDFKFCFSQNIKESIEDFEKEFDDWLVDIQETNQFTPLQVIGKFKELKLKHFGNWEDEKTIEKN